MVDETESPMPLTATLLALVQAATPAEPPACAVYEGWFEFARNFRGQTGTLTVMNEVRYPLYRPMYPISWTNPAAGLEWFERYEPVAIERERNARYAEAFTEELDEICDAPCRDLEIRIVAQHRALRRVPFLDRERVDVPEDIFDEIRALNIRAPLSCDWTAIGNGPVEISEPEDSAPGYGSENRSLIFSHAAMNHDHSMALIWVGHHHGRWGEFVLLEQESGHWRVIGTREIQYF